MTCGHCHKLNDYDASYCVHCGQPFIIKPVIEERDASTGYLLVAIMLSLCILQWVGEDWLGNYENIRVVLNVLRLLAIITMFIVIITYVRNRSYKIICSIIGLIFIANEGNSLYQYLQYI